MTNEQVLAHDGSLSIRRYLGLVTDRKTNVPSSADLRHRWAEFEATSTEFSMFAHCFFQYCLYTGTFARIAKHTTSIAHLGVRRFSRVLAPLPDRERQSRICQRVQAVERIQRNVVVRTTLLRRLRVQLGLPAFPRH